MHRPSRLTSGERGACSLVASRRGDCATYTAGTMGHVPQVDPELEAALRCLRAAFGPIEVLEVIDHRAD
jgi:hypothetical protein